MDDLIFFGGGSCDANTIGSVLEASAVSAARRGAFSTTALAAAIVARCPRPVDGNFSRGRIHRRSRLIHQEVHVVIAPITNIICSNELVGVSPANIVKRAKSLHVRNNVSPVELVFHAENLPKVDRRRGRADGIGLQPGVSRVSPIPSRNGESAQQLRCQLALELSRM
eukprot:CCRYP_016023-RB/>CCRYP_016023-RB protein AED:0.46 eAED:0.63 QI:0/0/0/1/0/0/3/0/167